jgi:branched-chain amino acid transport system substrate-binding protein
MTAMRWLPSRLLVLPLLAAVMLFALACEQEQEAPSPPQQTPSAARLSGVVKIGVPISITGTAVFAGSQQKEGIDLAVEEINRSGFLDDARIEVVYVDHKDTAEDGVNAVRQLISQGVVAITGFTWTHVALAAMPLINDAKVPTVVQIAAGKGIVESGPYAYRVQPQQDRYAYKMGEELRARGVRATALIYADDSPVFLDLRERFLRDVFPQVGIQVVTEEVIKVRTTDFTAIASKITSANPDAVGIFTAGAPNCTAVKQLRQAGYRGQIWGQYGMAGGVIANCGPEAEGVLFLQPFHPDLPFDSTKRFVQLFQNRYNKAPTVFHALGYDGMWMVARAVKAAGCVSAECIQRGLNQIASQGFEGAQGNLRFSERDAVGAGTVTEVKGGKEVLVR